MKKRQFLTKTKQLIISYQNYVFERLELDPKIENLQIPKIRKFQKLENSQNIE